MTLTSDQRWLLWTVGASISRALLSDAGLDHYLQSRCGYFGSAREGAPEWMDSFDTHAGKITSPTRGGPPKVVVTAKDIRRFRGTIPTALLTELGAIDQAETAEHFRTELWCRCHWTYDGPPKQHEDFLSREQYHPTDDEEQAHMAIVWTLHDRERDCLREILGIGTQPPGQQLDLFEVAS